MSNDEIAHNILQGTTGLYFVQGIGGSGKSTLKEFGLG